MDDEGLTLVPPTPWQVVGAMLATNQAVLVGLDRRGDAGVVAMLQIGTGVYRVQVDRLSRRGGDV